MKVPGEWKKYFESEFRLRCKGIESFTPLEISMLQKYGNWMQALMRREIQPTTDQQRRFVEVCYGKTEPRTKYEKAWMKYMRKLRHGSIPIARPDLHVPIDHGFAGSREAIKSMRGRIRGDMWRRTLEDRKHPDSPA